MFAKGREISGRWDGGFQQRQDPGAQDGGGGGGGGLADGPPVAISPGSGLRLRNSS